MSDIIQINSTDAYTLPGIREIYSVDCEKLQPNIRQIAASGNFVAVQTTAHRIRLNDSPSLSVSSENKSGSTSQSVTLKFSTPDKPQFDSQLGFIAVDQAGNRYLIGAGEPPYPQIKITRSSGTLSSEPATWTIEARLIGTIALIPCIF